MPRRELARDLFNNVFYRMVCKVTCPRPASLQVQYQTAGLLTRLEYLIFPKLPLRRMNRLFRSIVPTCGHPWLALFRPIVPCSQLAPVDALKWIHLRLVRYIALEHLSNYGFRGVIWVT
jgi:hypothetical protein